MIRLYRQWKAKQRLAELVAANRAANPNFRKRSLASRLGWARRRNAARG